MIKKYKEFIFEYGSNDYDYDEWSYSRRQQDEEFKKRFGEFKDFLAKKAQGPGSSPGISSSPGSYTPGSASFGDIDGMMSLVVKYLNKHGITNPLVQKAILSTIAKESGFTTTKETSYRNTSAARIKEVFGSRFSGMSDAEIDALKKDDNAFLEKVYGGEWGKRNLGNTNPGDGAKYVGRGFNGLTGRWNYQTYTDMLKKGGTNVDLISNPEILEKDPNISAEVNALYFITGLSDPIIKRKYGNSNPNDFDDFETALKAVVNTNAGPGNDINSGISNKLYNVAVAAGNSYSSKFDKVISDEKGKMA
jgi:predicted chitinase